MKLGRLDQFKTIIFCCDVQETFRRPIAHSSLFIPNVEARNILNLPMILTEQNPNKLGSTIPEINVQNIDYFSKTKFSMWTKEVENCMKNKYKDIDSIIIFGLESHICVQQTVFDLLEQNYNVHVLEDTVLSRKNIDKDRMRQAGAYITTLESALFSILRDYKHINAKSIIELIKKSN